MRVGSHFQAAGKGTGVEAVCGAVLAVLAEWRAGGGRWWGQLIMSAVFWQGQEWIKCVRLWLPWQFERD